jgi:uncharacterized protein with von Willebrand factor type A (vWA) domain
VFRAPRVNDVRLLLMMDVGGTMQPHAHLVERLFSAAYASRHLKDFRFYFFHNCVYAKLYQDEWLQEPLPTLQVMREIDSRYKLVIVGDASMAPSELISPWGALYRDEMTPTPGREWLQKLADHFPRTAWINPEPPGNWRWGTASMIRQMFPMFHLSIDGLDAAVHALVGHRGQAARAGLT